MKKIIYFIVFLLCFDTFIVFGQNASCASAPSLTPGAVGAACSNTTGSLAGYTETTRCSTTSREGFYQFNATATSHTIIVDGNSNFDAVISVGTSCATVTNLVNCFDNTFSGDIESVTLTGLTIGFTYYIAVRNYDSVGGGSNNNGFTICITTPPPPPSNDNCTGSVNLTQQSNGSCVTTNGTIAGASLSQTACVGSGNTDVWYSFTANNTSATISRNANFDSVVEIFSGSCGGTLTSLTCQDPESDVSVSGLTVGVTYFVRIYYYFSGQPTTPTFNICVTTPPSAPTNDNCGGAILLTHESFGSCTASSGTVTNATQSLAGCTGTADDDIWFRFVATSTIADIRVEWSQDEVVQVFSGSCGSLSSLVCQDTPEGSVQVTSLVVGQTYFIRVYSSTSFTPTYPSFSICVTTTGTSTNDLCSNYVQIPHSAAGTCNLVAGTVASATSSLTDCSGNGYTVRDVWYRFTATATTALVHRVADFSTIIQVFSAGSTCGALTSLNCFSSSSADLQLSGLTVGSNYLVRIYPASSTAPVDPRFTICITTPSTITNQTCAASAPICGSNSISFQAVTGGTAPAGNNYGCLSSQPAPAWFYFQVANSGSLIFGLEASADVDYAVWGPYNTFANATAACGSLPAPISCSFSIHNTESATINNALVGQVYILLITNFANVNQAINLRQIGGTGGTACSIVLGEGLADLKAINENEKNVLHWKLNPNQDILNFEISKSENAFDFRKIGTIEQNSNQEKTQFSFVDEEAQCGQTYYKLKIFHKDGKIIESPMVFAKRNDEICQDFVSIFPNPFVEFITINKKDDSMKETSFKLQDITGKTIEGGILSLKEKETKMPLQHLQKGVYLIEFQANNQIKRYKIIKN